MVSLGAAPISWGPPSNISGNNNANTHDVSTNGSLVEAFNFGATNAVTVTTANGVTFSGRADFLDGNSAASTFNGGSGDTSYDTLLRNIDFGDGGNLVTRTIGNGLLTPGQPYELQVWFVDNRNTRVMRFGDGESPENTVELSDQFSTGNFVADGPSQTLTLDALNFGNAHINAYQLRALPDTPLPPTVPVNVVATAGDARVNLSWRNNNQFGFSNFVVRRATTPGGPYTDIAFPSENAFTDSGLSNDTTYYYVVAAQNNVPETSANSNEVSATPVAFVPDAPEIPASFNSFPEDGAIVLNWADNLQIGFLEFRLFRATSSGGPYTQITSTTQSTFTDDTVTNGTTYYYVVTAVNSDGLESDNSNEDSATPAEGIVPPNFLFIITDDQDTYSIGAYRNLEPVELGANGQPYLVDTPNIDRLANEGMLFHQARIMGSRSAAVCLGTRTSIMTGKNPWENNTDVSAEVTFPAIFNLGSRGGNASRPYATYRTCKQGNSFGTANGEFSINNEATRRGNTDNNGSEWHKDRFLEHVDDWRVNHQDEGTPFFMYLGFSHPHDERNARETPALTTRYGCINTTTPASLTINQTAPPLPFNFLEATPATFPAHPFDNGDLNVRDERLVPGVLNYRTEAVVRNEIGRNLACVDWIDQQLEIVFARLEDPNNDGDTSDSVLDNTYIVFTSDHGMSIGRHGLMGKQNLYEPTLRVPYIVRGPGITPGTRSDALVYLHDTFPTFCDLAGIDTPTSIDDNDGRSFRSVLEGDSATHREKAYGMYAGGDRPGQRAITDGRFKLIKYDINSSNTQITQMFDLAVNPFELLPEHGTTNIANEPAYAAIRSQLEAQMMAERLRNNDPDPFLGDRTLIRFEDGIAGDTPATHADEFAFTNDAAALSGTGGNLPSLTSNVPFPTDFVLGEPNTLSLDLEQDFQQYLQIPHNDRAINFGAVPYTIEAWVKLETLPTGNNLASAMPVVMKKVIGASDADLDYLFLAAAGSYGGAAGFDKLAVQLGNGVIVSTLSIPDTNWHHISVAINPSNNIIRFTIDDQVDTQPLSALGKANTGPVVIGAHFDTSEQVDSSFDGCIDEFSITDGFLSLAELQPLMAVSDVADIAITDYDLDLENLTFNLTFASDETRLYTIERSTTLQANDWTELTDYTLIQGASSAGFTTTPALPLSDPNLAKREFFRVRTGNN